MFAVEEVGTLDNTVWVALIVALGSLMSTGLLGYLNGRSRRNERRELAVQRRKDRDADWARQDEVAARVETATGQVARQAAEANNKLDVIHTLVDGAMTEAMRSELEATKRELVMMKEVVALKEAAGGPQSMESVAILEATQAKIDELQTNLDARMKQVAAAELLQELQEDNRMALEKRRSSH